MRKVISDNPKYQPVYSFVDTSIRGCILTRPCFICCQFGKTGAVPVVVKGRKGHLCQSCAARESEVSEIINKALGHHYIIKTTYISRAIRIRNCILKFINEEKSLDIEALYSKVVNTCLIEDWEVFTDTIHQLRADNEISITWDSFKEVSIINIRPEQKILAA